jgi:hypothetical protein
MYFGGIMIGVVIAVSALSNWLTSFLPPQFVQQLSGGLMLVLMIILIGGLELSYIWRTAPYPHIQMLIRPYNELLELFIDDSRVVSKWVGENLWSTEIPLVFPRHIKSYGNAKITRIKLLHEYERSQRFDFKPGRASLDEYTFNHPQTEFVEVVQLPEKSHGVDHATVIPEFKVLAARNDYRRTFSSPTQKMSDVAQPPKTDPENWIPRITYEKALELLSAQKSETQYWHEIGIGMEQQFEGGRTETRGLLGAMNTGTAYAIETMLALIKAFGNVDRALEHLRGTSFDRWGKWVIMGLLAGGLIVYVQLNPGTLNGIYQYFNDPNHQIVVVAMLATLFLGVYLYMRRQRRPGN